MRRSNARSSCAEKLGHAPSIAFSLGFNSWMLLHKRDWQRMRAYALSDDRNCRKKKDSGCGFRSGTAVSTACATPPKAVSSRGLPRRSTPLTGLPPPARGVCQSHVHAPLAELLIEAGRAEEAVRRLDARIESAIRAAGARLSVRTLPSAGSCAPRSRRTRPGARGHCDGMRYRALAGRRDASAARRGKPAHPLCGEGATR